MAHPGEVVNPTTLGELYLKYLNADVTVALYKDKRYDEPMEGL